MASGRAVVALVALVAAVASAQSARWTEERASAWYAAQGWLIGANFAPSTAVNQIEMWNAATFNTTAIDRELGLAASLGFNSMRVFLHDILWREDAQGLIDRMETYLGIAASHGIGTMFVIFDGVWDPYPVAGAQLDPRPYVHNSRWVQGPGRLILGDTSRHQELRDYVVGVITRFANDPRVQVWDLFNEPDNPVPQYSSEELPDKAERALELLEASFEWAREVNPSQPLTAGVWAGSWARETDLSPIQRVQLDSSDIITFHNYGSPADVQTRIGHLRRYNRPILCTEYMARGAGSTFEGVLPILKNENVGAYNWGFVDGRTQTIYPWDSWDREYTGEPDPWFHDIFRGDGSSYRVAETDLIRNLTGVAR